MLLLSFCFVWKLHFFWRFLGTLSNFVFLCRNDDDYYDDDGNKLFRKWKEHILGAYGKGMIKLEGLSRS